MMKQYIPSMVWTKLDGAEMSVYQNSGASSWVELTDEGIHCGPIPEGCEWKVAHNSGMQAPEAELPRLVIRLPS